MRRTRSGGQRGGVGVKGRARSAVPVGGSNFGRCHRPVPGRRRTPPTHPTSSAASVLRCPPTRSKVSSTGSEPRKAHPRWQVVAGDEGWGVNTLPLYWNALSPLGYGVPFLRCDRASWPVGAPRPAGRTRPGGGSRMATLRVPIVRWVLGVGRGGGLTPVGNGKGPTTLWKDRI